MQSSLTHTAARTSQLSRLWPKNPVAPKEHLDKFNKSVHVQTNFESSTLYEGLPDRLEKELNALCPQQGVVNIIAPPDRYYSVWCGGSTLCSLTTFASKWITKEEYDEHGAEIVHRKCQ